MYKLLIFCLLISLESLAQSGRYSIESENNRSKSGYITISPYNITISQDSTEITLPVVNVIEEKHKFYYIIEGCQNNRGFKGAATLYNSEVNNPRGKMVRCVLYIEIRTSVAYSSTRYSLYYYYD